MIMKMRVWDFVKLATNHDPYARVATSSTGITSPQSQGAGLLSLSAGDFVSASGFGRHFEHSDNDQRARARRREKRRVES